VTIRIPSPPRPAASVVMVTHGAWGWTERALRALVAHTPEDFELIIVDNASPAAMRRRLREEVEGARLVLNPENLGFGTASNQGVELARGRHVVFLNSDALVRPGWLAPLLRAAQADGVGVVGPMVLNLDGTLQEAGNAIWRDGVTTAVGAGEDPARPEHRAPRTVDYVSAACMLVRRSAFEAVGGFDPLYAPAYYEDADLCMALADAGLRTEYEPGSVVVHARGASVPHERALALVRRNRSLFRRRWAAALDDRPVVPWPLSDRSALRGRDLVAPVRILVTADRVPGPGEPARRRLEAIAAGWPRARLTLLAPAAGDAADAEALTAAGVEVAAGVAEPAGWLEGRAGHYEVLVRAGPDDAGLLDEALARTQPRAALVVTPEAGDLDSLALALREADGQAARTRLHITRERLLARFAAADVVLLPPGEPRHLAHALAGEQAALVADNEEGPDGLVVALARAGVAPPA
jgi:GT2 family glycosyltransferase